MGPLEAVLLGVSMGLMAAGGVGQFRLRSDVMQCVARCMMFAGGCLFSGVLGWIAGGM